MKKEVSFPKDSPALAEVLRGCGVRWTFVSPGVMRLPGGVETQFVRGSGMWRVGKREGDSLQVEGGRREAILTLFSHGRKVSVAVVGGGKREEGRLTISLGQILAPLLQNKWPITSVRGLLQALSFLGVLGEFVHDQRGLVMTEAIIQSGSGRLFVQRVGEGWFVGGQQLGRGNLTVRPTRGWEEIRGAAMISGEGGKDVIIVGSPTTHRCVVMDFNSLKALLGHGTFLLRDGGEAVSLSQLENDWWGATLSSGRTLYGKVLLYDAKEAELILIPCPEDEDEDQIVLSLAR